MKTAFVQSRPCTTGMLFCAMTFMSAVELTACAPLVPYVQPTMQLTARPTSQSSASSNDIDIASWWTSFNDPKLSSLITKLLAQNLSLQAAAARVDQARAASREAGARELPSIEFDSGVVAQHQSMDTSIGEIARHSPYYRRNPVSFNVGVGASWEIDPGRGTQHYADARGAEADAAEGDALALRVSLIGEMADAFLQVNAARTRLSLLDKQILNGQHVLDVVRRRFNAGAGSQREVSLAEAAVARARSLRPALHIALVAQTLRIDRLLGEQPGEGDGSMLARQVESDPPPAPVAAMVDNQPQELLRGRPDVVAAERRLAAAHSRVGLAVSEFYPKVSLAGLLGSTGMTGTPWLGVDGFSPQAGIGLRWRLFDFGRVQAEVDGANASEKIAIADYRMAVLSAVEDVQRSVDRRDQLADQSRGLSLEVTALEQSRNASLEAYKAGSISVSDVLLSDDQLLQAQDSLAQSSFDELRALVDVYRSLGGGWKASRSSTSGPTVARLNHVE